MTSSLAPSVGALARLPSRLGGWVCEHLLLDGEQRLVARFKSVSASDWVEVSVTPLGAPGRVFLKLERCQVSYRGQLAVMTDARRAEFAAIVRGVGAAVDARLAALPGATIAEALGRSREARVVVFSPETLRDLLAPDITEDVPVCDGWRLLDVYPSSNVRELPGARHDLVLDFRHDASGRRALIVVGSRHDENPTFVTTAHLSVGFLSLGVGEPPGVESLRALVGFVLQLRDHDALTVVFEDPARAVLAAPGDAAEAALEPRSPDEVLNLAISAECEQSCAFCTVKETWPPDVDVGDGGDATLERLCHDLLRNRRRGVRALRVNGYDPLAYSRVLDVLRFATSLGYERAEVFSPCTRLADDAFCDAVVGALPRDARFYVPLYGHDAATHDAVVGREGAFDLATRALENLLARVGPAGVTVLSVITRENLHALPAVAAVARAKGAPFCAHMPYPSFESRADRYYTCAPRQADVVDALADALAGTFGRDRPLALALEGVAPCVLFRAMRARGVAVKDWLFVPERPPALPGTEYRDPRYRHRDEHAAFRSASVPCPHAARCALAPACPGEVLRAYADLYGTEEFQPVSLRALVEAT